MATHQFYQADQYLLYLDGQPTKLEDFDGGNVKGGIATEDSGFEDSPPMKNISSLKFEPMVIKTGLSMGKGLYEWIRSTIDKTDLQRDGCVVSTTGDRRASGLRYFHNAVLTVITLPALDVKNRERAFFEITFEPETITDKDGDGSSFADAVDKEQKEWLCSTFRLRLGDLPCAHVRKIDSFTIRQVLTSEVKGDFRVSTRLVPKLLIPELKITLSPEDIQPWSAWFNEFVVKGRNSQADELSGAIEFLDSGDEEVLGSVDLSQVGIFAFSPEKATEEGNNRVSQYLAELYVEKMTLNLGTVR
jgi:hypothetical protein